LVAKNSGTIGEGENNLFVPAKYRRMTKSNTRGNNSEAQEEHLHIKD